MIPALFRGTARAGRKGEVKRNHGNRKEKDKGRGIHDTNEGA